MRVAVIGVGAIAKVLLPAIIESECTIEGVMSRSGDSARRMARRYGIPRVYDSLQDIDTDAAFVLTGTESHTRVALPLLERGIPVFLEKPMAMTLRDAERLTATADRKGVLLMVGFNRRYAPVYEALKSAWRHDIPDVIIAEKNRPDIDYRGTLDNAIHIVDMMRWICGEAIEVTASSQYSDPYHETSCVAHLRFAHSIGVMVANRSCGQWAEHIETYGAGKTVRVEAPESFAVIERNQTRTTSLLPASDGLVTPQTRLGFRQEVEDFLRVIQSGGEVRSPARDAMETHRLMHRILQAAGLPDMNDERPAANSSVSGGSGQRS